VNLLRDCDWREKTGLGSNFYHESHAYVTSSVIWQGIG